MCFFEVQKAVDSWQTTPLHCFKRPRQGLPHDGKETHSSGEDVRFTAFLSQDQANYAKLSAFIYL